MTGKVIEGLVKKYTPNYHREWNKEQEMLETIRETLIGRGWRRKRSVMKIVTRIKSMVC